MRSGQVVYTVSLTLVVMLTIIVLGFPGLAANSEDRQAILAIGSSALGVLVTLGSQAFFARNNAPESPNVTDGQADGSS
jgi:hypothetical protein